MKIIKPFLLLLSVIILLASCGIYSFTGASIPPGAKTVSVQYFPNKAATIHPNLSQVFTEKLKDVFVEQTNLTLTDDEGDLSFSGHISKYQIKPMAIQSNETAGQNRLTIAVNVTFKSAIDIKANFEQTFSRYRDYNSSENISEIEEQLYFVVESKGSTSLFDLRPKEQGKIECGKKHFEELGDQEINILEESFELLHKRGLFAISQLIAIVILQH